jgi:serine/threonine protein kinase
MSGTPFGKYLLFERIAAGGMAEIYRAKYVAVAGVTKNVVIKKILPHYAGNRNFVSMFINEAKIAVGLSHGNIAQIFDFGEIDGEYYLAMEYVDGQTVSKLMRRAREKGLPVPVPFAVFIAIELCKGLHYAHTRVDEQQRPVNIVHRDISPQNVIISYEGQVKIVDFGIAKARMAGMDPSDKTQAGAIKGKYVYFSPEQARARDLDGRTDIYATGVVLYEMLTGKLPFEGKMIEVLNRIVRGDFAKPSTLNADIAPQLEGIILKAMATNKDERYPTALALQEALSDYLFTSAPRFNQASLGQLVDYLFSDELAAEGRSVQLPAQFLEQLKDWKMGAPTVVEMPKIEVEERQTTNERISNSDLRAAVGLKPSSGDKGKAGSSSSGADRGGDLDPNADTQAFTQALIPGLGDSGPQGLPPVQHTGSAFLPPIDKRLRLGLSIGGFVLAAVVAGSLVVWIGQPKPASIKVKSTPSGLSVVLDGNDTGKVTPAVIEIRQPDIDHFIDLIAPGMKPYQTVVHPRQGSQAEVDAKLEPQTKPTEKRTTTTQKENDPGPAVGPRQAVLDGISGSIALPTTHAARVKLNPKRTYRLSVEGIASLGGLNALYQTRGCFFFVEHDKSSPVGGPTFGYLAPKTELRVLGAREIYGFVVDENPADNSGVLTLTARDAHSSEQVKLKVDAKANSVWPEPPLGVHLADLGNKRYTLEMAGGVELGGRNGRTERAIYWYDGEASLTLQGKNVDANHGMLRVGEKVVLESPSKLILFLPDDDPADNKGSLTATLTPIADAAPKH